MSKTIIAVRHFGLGGRESLETAVTTLRVKANFINGRDKKTKWRRVLDDFVSFNMLELQ